MSRKTLLVKIIISLGLLVFVGLKVDISEIKAMAHNIHPISWIYALVFMFLQMIGLSARWAVLMNVNNKKRAMDFVTALRISAVSFLANYLFITTLGGIIVRIALTMGHGFPFVKSLAAAVIDRGMTLLALLILAAVFMPSMWNFLQPQLASSSSLLICALLIVASAFGLYFVYKNRRAIIFSNRKVAIGYKYLHTLMTDPVRLGEIIAISIASQVMYFSAVYVIMNSLVGTDFSFFKFMAVIPVITLVASLPVGYGGWGIREAAFIYGLSLINMPLEAAFMASVQIGLISMLAATISGIPAFITDETQNAVKYWRMKRKRVNAHS